LFLLLPLLLLMGSRRDLVVSAVPAIEQPYQSRVGVEVVEE
jgi:hypothetical protein